MKNTVLAAVAKRSRASMLLNAERRLFREDSFTGTHLGEQGYWEVYRRRLKLQESNAPLPVKERQT